ARSALGVGAGARSRDNDRITHSTMVRALHKTQEHSGIAPDRSAGGPLRFNHSCFTARPGQLRAARPPHRCRTVMKISTRFAATITTASALALTLSSCGFSGSPEGGGAEDEEGGGATTLDLLVPSYSDNTQALWEEVIDGFEEENDDITV